MKNSGKNKLEKAKKYFITFWKQDVFGVISETLGKEVPNYISSIFIFSENDNRKQDQTTDTKSRQFLFKKLCLEFMYCYKPSLSVKPNLLNFCNSR